MNETITIQATVMPDGTLKLDGPVTMPPGPVEVIIRPLIQPTKGETGLAVLLRIRAEQQTSGYVPPRSAEEIDAYIREMREEWEERAREIESIQEEGRKARQKSENAGS